VATTIGGTGTAAAAGADHRFFLTMAIAMAVVVVLGFSMQLAMGRSSFRVPVAVHVHALVFFGWTAFYVYQNALVATGSLRLHRRLGWIGTGWAALVVILGLYMTAMMVRRGATPFFFAPGYFLFMNSLTVLGFGGLFAAAIRLRRRTAWHRRLMLCAMAMLTGPAFGRLLPMPLMIPWAGWGVFAAVMAWPVIGMVADIRRTGAIHRAWRWGVGTMVAIQLAIGIVAVSAPGLAIYRTVVAGGAGETVDPLAYPAPPG
jgi:hypothetical protein